MSITLSRRYRSCRTYTEKVRQSAVAMVQAGQPISAVAELRAEVAQLREDSDLLGKASAYFARHAKTRRS